MRVILLVMVLAMPASAQTVPPWVGYWAGDGQDCALAGEMAEEMPIELTARDEFGMEYSCEFKAVTPIGVGQSWKIERKCMDAGFIEFWNVILVLNSQNELLMIDDLGEVSRLKRCESPSN